MAIETLNSMEFPESSGIERGVFVPPECRSAGFDDEYDLRTFIYDAFFVPRKQAICIICPKLYQFDTVIKHGKFTANGQQLKPKVKLRKGNSDEIWLPCNAPPESLRIQIGSFDHETTVGIQDNETFRGLWCAVLKSKDNDLVWIKDWVNYHVKVHGLNGLVFFDNGSEQYSLEELHSALISISGLEKVRVLSAPFRFGPITLSPYRHITKFLQAGLLNIARVRYLQSAAAVLNVDIDELVSPSLNGSIFQSAENSPLGYVSFSGRWRYPDISVKQQFRHKDHILESSDGFCQARKYCVCPSGPLRHFYWNTHTVRAPFLWGASIDRIISSSRMVYWHCRKITTHWKSQRGVPPTNQLTDSPETKQVFDRVF